MHCCHAWPTLEPNMQCINHSILSPHPTQGPQKKIQKTSAHHPAGAPSSLASSAPPTAQQEEAERQTRPCKVLLCGQEGSGQGHVAAAVLKLLLGAAVHTLSLPTLVVGGSGDTTAGMVQLIQEALRRCHHCVFMGFCADYGSCCFGCMLGI